MFDSYVLIYKSIYLYISENIYIQTNRSLNRFINLLVFVIFPMDDIPLVKVELFCLLDINIYKSLEGSSKAISNITF